MLKHKKIPIIFNLDDFSEEIMTSDLWKNILELKKTKPKLKITMFTTPLLCSEKWLNMIKTNYQWMELHYHGSDHKNPDEWFEKLTFDFPFGEYFYKGFKAPWWRMDQKTANVFNMKKFTLSTMNNHFDVQGEKVYRFNLGKELIHNVAYQNKQYVSLNSHVQPQKGKDGLPDIFDQIVKLIEKHNKFLFISELFN